MLDYVLLGVIQGIFEWLPVSSEGIAALFADFLKIGNPLDVALFLHFGTLLASIIYFKQDWLRVIRIKDKKFFQFLLISSPISLLVGYVLYNMIQGQAIGRGLLFLTGCGLLITAFLHKKKVKFALGDKETALLSGLLQGLAVIPGLSRSGATVFGLSLSNMSPDKILKYSYMMSVPAITASTLYFLLKDVSVALIAWPAIVSSFVTGYFCLGFLIKISQKIDFFKFAFGFSLFCFLGFLLSFLV